MAEHLIVDQAVVGSRPIGHPKRYMYQASDDISHIHAWYKLDYPAFSIHTVVEECPDEGYSLIGLSFSNSTGIALSLFSAF